jgi:hypothetical protein
MLDKYFYFAMSLLIPAIVIYGFSHTVNENLLHAAVPRPTILWFHSAVFSGWVLFFIFQSALVRTGNVRVHRVTGWFGAALGAAIPVLGVATAVIMTRFKVHQLHQANTATFIMVPLLDVCCFTSTFWLAIYWRKKPEFHRRLVLMATCALTAAAFGRFPESILPGVWFYAGVDALILLGVARDLIVNRRVHRVYVIGLPLFAVCQFAVIRTLLASPAWWVKISNAIAG